MHQAFDALFQLNECAVVGHGEHAALDLCIHRVTLGGVEPRIGCEDRV